MSFQVQSIDWSDQYADRFHQKSQVTLDVSGDLGHYTSPELRNLTAIGDGVEAQQNVVTDTDVDDESSEDEDEMPQRKRTRHQWHESKPLTLQLQPIDVYAAGVCLHMALNGEWPDQKVLKRLPSLT